MIVVALCVLGIASVNLLWLFEYSENMLSDLDRYGYPLLLSLFVGALIVIFFAPAFSFHAEVALYGGVSLYFLAALFSFSLFQSENRVYTVANTLQWMPIIYVVAFVMFRRKVAMMAAGTVFVLSLLPSLGILAVKGAAYWDLTIGALLANAYVAHCVTLLALSLVALLDGEYERVALRATTMENAAATDGLTGIANRRGIDQILRGLEQPTGVSVALIMVDVDHFKSVNDRFGHLVGDDLLVHLAQRIGSRLHNGEALGRWGGEELLVIAGETGEAAAIELADLIRRFVGEWRHPVVGRTTVSVGVTVWTTGTSVSDALRRADNALYQAKTLGRDRVELL